jgi:hypothetical protein
MRARHKQNLGWAYIADLSLIVPGVLLVAPWSRIRPRAVWYTLFVALVALTPAAALFLFALNTWSRMHRVGEALDALITLLVVGWASQLPAIWTLRPRDVAGEPERAT